MEKSMFSKALPVWIDGKENEMNIQAKFTARFIGKEDTVLKITGATIYKVFLNGELIHYGPAHTAKGYVRVDRVKLNVRIGEENEIVIEAAGYNSFSYVAIKETSFIRAEVISGGECVLATGYDFKAFLVTSRRQKTLRYSFQRHFTEIWDMEKLGREEKIKVLEHDLKYLERKAPLPEILNFEIGEVYTKDSFTYNVGEIQLPSLQGATDSPLEYINNFPLEEIEDMPIKDLMLMNYKAIPKKEAMPLKLGAGEYVVLEHKRATAGLINLKYFAKKGTKIIIAFDEKMIDGRFNVEDWEMFNTIEVLGEGEIDFTSFEIYGFKYFAVFVTDGGIELKNAGVVEIKCPINNVPKLNCNDEKLLKIFDSGIESARCNFLGIFMDCPSRERAGWLCDSYYSGKAFYKMTGTTSVEDDFIENLLLSNSEYLPKGMFPMCYPADHPNGNFIPQWAMWFIVEIEDYLNNRNKKFDVKNYKERIYKLFEYFEGYENEFGLLEDLEGWNFVEWSKANDWVGGVNFPTNMLYSKVLSIVGNWYDDEKLTNKSKNVKDKVIEMSYDGKFFKDQALRDEDNNLVCMGNISEVCQYYAFIYGVADELKFANLKNMMIEEFKTESNIHPNVEKVNAFMGMYMRMELLLKWGYTDLLLEDIKAFFGHMADITGTLWEHKAMTNSLNHGFASYIVVLLLEIFNSERENTNAKRK